MRGRKPIPHALKLVKGNPGKRPMAGDLKPGNEAPTPPKMNDQAMEVWNETIPELYRLGVIARIDKNQIAAYCNIEARRRQAQKALDDYGDLVYETRGPSGAMIRHRPEIKIVSDCEKQLKSFAVEWGMTASSRVRLGDPNQGRLDLGDDPTSSIY